MGVRRGASRPSKHLSKHSVFVPFFSPGPVFVPEPQENGHSGASPNRSRSRIARNGLATNASRTQAPWLLFRVLAISAGSKMYSQIVNQNMRAEKAMPRTIATSSSIDFSNFEMRNGFGLERVRYPRFLLVRFFCATRALSFWRTFLV